MLDFSIIIPVYNSEKTLKRCLNSIKAQTFSNYEVILIDDGSRDNSLSICKEYETQDQRYKVFHQSNKGPSVARNVGLDVAKGRWVCFVDSDDTVESGYLHELFDTIQKYEADVVFIGQHKFYENGNKESFIPDDVDENVIKTFENLSDKDMFGYTWIKSFRKNVIGNIRFDSALSLFEDEVFTCQVLPNCTRVGVVRKPIYNYYIGDSNTLMGRTYDDYCLKCDKVYQAWQKLLSMKSNKKDFMNKKANSFVSRCYYYAFERDVDLKKYFSYLKETTFFQEHTKRYDYDEFVKNENYKKIKLGKMKYQTKVYFSMYLKR